MAETAERLERGIDAAFEGDAHAYMVSIYKNPARPETLRLDAAKAAARYEKPALSSVEAKHSGTVDVRAWLMSLGEADDCGPVPSL